MSDYKFSGYLVLTKKRWSELSARLSVSKPPGLMRGQVLVYFTIAAPSAWFAPPPMFTARVTLDDPGAPVGGVEAIARAVSQVTGLTVVIEESPPDADEIEQVLR